MAQPRVAIIGAGVAAAAIADQLTGNGHPVTLFEKGDPYPYPHGPQFQERVTYRYTEAEYKELPPDLKNYEISGDYQPDLNTERFMAVGGSTTHWSAITLRMRPADFRTKTLFGFGANWPISYDDLEPYYGRAETLLGVSGTDDDNPFAPPRSTPYPLPPFELSYDDQHFADMLRQHDITLHTTPQARARLPYEQRPGCENYNSCLTCPIGARYSANYHLIRAQRTGLLTLNSGVSVRQIVVDRAGGVRGVLYRENAGGSDQFFDADVVILAAGGIESIRLMLLSDGPGHPDGLGNSSGQVGRGFLFHKIWAGKLFYPEMLAPGRLGAYTGQSHQFLDPAERGTLGGIKIEFSDNNPLNALGRSAEQIVSNLLTGAMRTRRLGFHCESNLHPDRRVTLGERRDRFGDSFAHVHYTLTDFDALTYGFAQDVLEQFRAATGADSSEMQPVEEYVSGAHHMGGLSMSDDIADGVVDSFGRVHGIPNLFVAGSSIFVGGSGAVNPTLTLIALALRTADYLEDQIL